VKGGRALLNAGVRKPIIHDAHDSRVTRLIWLVADLGNGRVSGGQPNPTRCNLVFNATPMGLAESDWLPVPAELLVSSTFVGDVITGNGGRRSGDDARFHAGKLSVERVAICRLRAL
jgi:shikimate dehydrogenase